MDKFILDNYLLILLALVSGGLLFWPALRRQGGGKVNATEAVRLINREKAVLIDVSEPGEYAQGHAGGARNVPLGSLDASSKDLPKNKALPVVVLCPTGARAGRAVAALKKLGFENATALAGGTSAWREASLPIEKAAE